MNLGLIYIQSFLLIVVASSFVAFALASMLRLRRVSWHLVVVAALPLWLAIGFFALSELHQPLFVVSHRWQNEAVPATGCLTYEAEFNRLYAAYRMNRDDFIDWVESHLWNLRLGNNSLLHHDGTRL